MVKRKRDANKIIVVGLPEGTDNEALEAMFADIGKVYAAHVVGLDDSTGASKGYGFVTFADAESCNLSIEKMHKTVIEGRTINVRMVEEREATEVKGRDSNKVIVAGLTQTMTDEKLQLMCEEFGLVLKAAVVRNPVSGKSKGFGFVTFTNRSCQQACIMKLDKRQLGGGRILNVRAVDARQPNGSLGTDKTDGETGGEKSANKKTTFGDTEEEDDGDKKEGICIRFQMNKCHRGKGCRWRHVKIPDFEKVSKKEMKEKKKESEMVNEKISTKKESKSSKINMDEAVEKKKSVVKSMVVNGKTIAIDENDTEEEDSEDSDDDDDGDDKEPTVVRGEKFVNKKHANDSDDSSSEEEEEEEESSSKANVTKLTQGVTVFDDSDDSDEEVGKQQQDNSSNFVTFDDDDEDEDDGITQINMDNFKKQSSKSTEFNDGGDMFDDSEEEESDEEQVKGETSPSESSVFQQESKSAMELMNALLKGEGSKEETIHDNSNISKKSSKKDKILKKKAKR